MRIKNSSIFFFICFILCFSSCKKDIDDTGPNVKINDPFDGQYFNVNDVLQVKGTVRDETGITAVSIRLVDANLITAHISIAVPVSSPSMNINAQYTLDNIHLESGTYYLLVTATDGKNDSHTYRKININSIPRVVKKVLVASSSSTSQTNFSFIDSAFTSLNFYKTFAGDYMGSAVSSYYQQVYRCGNFTGNFTAVKLSDDQTRFSISPVVSSTPYFTGFYSTDKNNYVGFYDEFVRGYDQAGNIIFNATSNLGYYPKHMCLNDNYLVAEEKNKITSSRNLVTFYPTGIAQQTCVLNQDVAALCEKSHYEVFAFGNNSGQGVIQLFDRLNNKLWDPYPYSLPAGTILSAVKIDDNTYLFGHSDGTIYKYTYNSPGIYSYLPGYTAIQLKYDPQNNFLFIAEANSITLVDYPSATPINSISSSETVLDIHLLYNR